MTTVKARYLLAPFLILSVLAMNCTEADLPLGDHHIIPQPKSLELADGHFAFNHTTGIFLEEPNWQPALEVFLPTAAKVGWSPRLSDAEDASIVLKRRDGFHEEGYRLDIAPEHILIEASTEAGLSYALQSLLQLFPVGDLADRWLIPCVTIDDQPRFGWRGFMLDVSRHFFSVDEVKFFLDQMHRLKLNVFHWHLTDDQGWRIESKVYPKLNEVGSWRVDYTDYDWSHNRWWGRPTQQPGDTATYGGYYTQEEIRDIVAYAAERQIEVLPEIDVPGHSQAIIASYPHVACHGGPYYVATGGAYRDNTLCPGKEDTYAFMENVLNEIMSLFPFEYLHIGGDECNKSAWKIDPDCQSLMRREGLANEEELQSYFIRRMEEIVSAGGKHMIGWDEILEGGLAPGAAVMSWRGEEGGIAAGQAGHEVIMTPSSRTYLDLKQGHPDHEPNLGYARCLLTDVYNYDPIPKSLEQHADLVLGMQGNLWSESLPTLDMATYMTFPRLFAIAESAWTDPARKDLAGFIPRMRAHMKIMDEQGITTATSPFDVWIEHSGSEPTVTVRLRTEVGDYDIHYTLDGSTPSQNSPLYTEPFELENSSMVRAGAWHETELMGNITEKYFSVHQATLAQVTVDLPPGIDPDKVDQLADHNYGSNWSVDTMWTSFRSPEVQINLRWPETIEISSVGLNFLQMAITGIYMPAEIKISAIGEDQTEIELASRNLEDHARVQGRYIHDERFEVSPTSTKQLMISLKAVNPIYQGHHLAGSLGRIFLDEIIVN